MNNPLSGYNAAGPRFKLRIRSLAHNNIYLPLSMCHLPQILQLQNGISPLTVFNSPDIQSARQAFYELRKKFDFPYWAALEFKIQDIADQHNIITLRLNPHQHFLVDTLIRRSAQDIPSKYIISKTTPRCGLTTCVQAYILWQQKYYPDIAFTCAPSDSMKETLRSNIARSLNRKGVSNLVLLPDSVVPSFFQSIYSPNTLDNVPDRYVHLADMSKWLDHSPDLEVTSHILNNALINWNRKAPAIFIIEGDRPTNPKFRMQDHQNYHLPDPIRFMNLSQYTDNPLFLNILIKACDPKLSPQFHHIDLNQATAQ